MKVAWSTKGLDDHSRQPETVLIGENIVAGWAESTLRIAAVTNSINSA